MDDWMLAAFVIACGFTLSGIVTSLDGMMHGGEARFTAAFASFGDAAWSIVLSAFGGPFIVAGAAFESWRRNGINAVALLAAGTLSAIWAFCSGVLMLQLLALAGLVGPA